jgi:hypothetical protein
MLSPRQCFFRLMDGPGDGHSSLLSNEAEAVGGHCAGWTEFGATKSWTAVPSPTALDARLFRLAALCISRLWVYE